jgi:hypothetical protein
MTCLIWLDCHAAQHRSIINMNAGGFDLIGRSSLIGQRLKMLLLTKQVLLTIITIIHSIIVAVVRSF